ncbi:unnamed protein product [Hyaloperonospora brassicae]|uniref:Tetraspanin n=1 Tax=Hyaloperonospora brassicae TaxID=162125 RepID=A0AAV0U0J3_HYABA|nr:unnamed protein product [Hyaloperonospora brassicae]
MAFLVAGCLLVYFSHRVTSSGWLEAFGDGDYAWIGPSTLVFLLVLGALVMALSSLGCFGALLQQKLLLTVYALVLALTLVLFGVMAVGGHVAQSTATEWQAQAYPVTAKEASLGAHFSRLYCHAQVPHYCYDATVHTVLDMFNVSLADHFLDSTTNFTNVCAAVTLPAIGPVCAVCTSMAAAAAEYAMVRDWAEASCPRTSANELWCGRFLLNNATATGADAIDGTAPFLACRRGFYDLVEKWTHVVLVGSVVCIAAALVGLGMTRVLWRNVQLAHRPKDRRLTASTMPVDHYDDPHVGFSQRSEATNTGAFSMYSTTAARDPTAAHRRYNSPF